METTQIAVDLEVYKAIEHERQSFNETVNDILRRKYQLNPREDKKPEYDKGGLHVSGTLLRNGLKLRRSFKGSIYEAKVENNKIIYNGKAFTAPSAPAVEATGTSVNGWQWWEYFDENTNSWRVLDRLRRTQRVS